MANQIIGTIYRKIVRMVKEYVNGTHVTPSGNISKFSLDFLGQGEKTSKDGKAGGLQHTDGIYISINPIGNAKFHKTYGTKEVVQRDDVDELGRGGYKVYTYYLQIPDLGRENYMFEYEPVQRYPRFLEAVNNALERSFGRGAGLFLGEDGTISYSLGDAGEKSVSNEPFIKSNTLTCANYYRLLKELFFQKDGKRTSQMLADCGVVGMIYHGHQDALCAVIYDTSKIKIVSKKAFDVKKGAKGDDIKKDYLSSTDYTERLDKYNSEHPEEFAQREKFKGHIATKPKGYVAGKKYDSPLNFPYPIDGAFKGDKSHNIAEGKMEKKVVKINEATIRKMVAESIKKTIKEGVVGPGDPNYDVFRQKLHDYQKECEKIDAEFNNSLTPEEKEYISQGGNWIGKWGRELELRKKKGLTRPPKPTYERGKSNYMSPEQARANGFKKSEYQDNSRNHEIWSKGKERIKVDRELQPGEKNTGKTGFAFDDHGLKESNNNAKANNNKDMEKRKNAVKINESQLRNIVAESVKNVLKEMDDSSNYFRGVDGVKMHYHGSTADPELSYNGKKANYWTIEDAMWDWYKEECASRGVAADENDDEGFNQFCQEHKQDIIDYINQF